MKKIFLYMIISLCSLVALAQNEIPADFTQGSVITATYEKQDGYIKDNLKKDGSIIFLNAQGQKKVYNVNSLQSFSVNNTDYISYLYDFYKTIATGSKLALYQKITDNNGKVISNGNESVTATTTDGKIGDYYLQLKKDSDLTLVTKKNFTESVSNLCADCSEVIADVKSKQVDYTQLAKVVEKYNNCIK